MACAKCIEEILQSVEGLHHAMDRGQVVRHIDRMLLEARRREATQHYVHMAPAEIRADLTVEINGDTAGEYQAAVGPGGVIEPAATEAVNQTGEDEHVTYADPANREPEGPPRRRRGRPRKNAPENEA